MADMDDNEFMLLMHSVVEAARERWPKKDDDYLFSEIQDALAAAFEEQPARVRAVMGT